MKRTIAALAFLLLTQFAMTVILNPATDDRESSRGYLLPASTAIQVDEIRIVDNMDNELILNRHHGRWILPDLQDLPADRARVARLLAVLTETPHGGPVTESTAARQRFRVASYYYKRRISLRGNGQSLATIYLGRAPFYRQVYLRSEGEQAIYSLHYADHAAAVVADTWLDPNLLQLTEADSIDIDDLSLRCAPDGQWRTTTGQALDSNALNALLAALAQVKVAGLADEDSQRSLAESGDPSRILRVTRGAGPTVKLALFHEGQHHYAHDSRYGVFFLLSADQYQQLLAPSPGGLAGDGANK